MVMFSERGEPAGVLGHPLLVFFNQTVGVYALQWRNSSAGLIGKMASHLDSANSRSGSVPFRC